MTSPGCTFDLPHSRPRYSSGPARRLVTILLSLSLALLICLVGVHPASAQDNALPYLVAPINTSGPKVFAHYFPPYPISLDNRDPSADYYTRHYLNPEGENGKFLAVGGLLRDRPVGRQPLGGDYRLTDAATEVRQAASSGIDGFTIDIMSWAGTNWDRTLLMAKAASLSKTGFVTIPNIDLSTDASREAPVATIAAKLNTFYSEPSAYRLPDGRYVLSSFKAEAQPASWWQAVASAMEQTYGKKIALITVFLDLTDARIESYRSVSYAMSIWGLRTAESVRVSPDKAGKVHNAGMKWMAPIAIQDVRHQHMRYAESGNTETLRASWTRALLDKSDMVQLVTWNDYSESTQFAPSQGHSTAFLDMNGYYVAQFKNGQAPAITGDQVIITHRIQGYAKQPSAQTGVMDWTLSGNGTPPRDTVEAVTLLKAPATVTVHAGGKTTTYTAPAGISAKVVELSRGEISASVVRGSTPVASVKSPNLVSSYPTRWDLQYYAATSRGPAAPSGLTAVAHGASVNLAWTAATDNVGVTKYEVHRSTTSNFSPTTATSVGEVTGTSTVNTPTASGTYYYKVRVVDAAGNVSPASNEAAATATVITTDTTPPSAPGEATGTESGDDVTLGWVASTDNIGVVRYDVHRSTTAGFTPSPVSKVAASTTSGLVDGGLAAGTYHYRIVAVDAAGNASAPSRQVTVVVDLAAPSAPTGLSAEVDGSTVTLDWTASTDDIRVASYDVHRSTTPAFTPSSATLIGTTASPGYVDLHQPTGTVYYKVVAGDAADKISAPSAVVSATVADTTSPSMPAELTATVTNSTVALSWGPASDDVAVTGYEVHRSLAGASFSPTTSTKIADPTGRAHSDPSRPAGTYYYKIVARDAAGNLSAPSVSASVRVVSQPTIQTLALAPIEDAYANKGAPTSNFGASTSTASRGGTTPYTAYLKFDVAPPPAGATLVSAKLTVRTSTESFAGSADAHQVALAPTTWTETGLTWNNKPALGQTLGQFATNSEVNSSVEASLNAGQFAAAGSGTVSLAVTSTGSDNLWFWTRTQSTPSYRPSLVLTYQVPS